MARLLVYPALAALAAWGALVLLKTRGELPEWASWTIVHGAPAAAYLAWALVVSYMYAVRRWRFRYSLRSLMLFVFFAGCCEALYIDWEPWVRASSFEPSESYQILSIRFLSSDGKIIEVIGNKGASKSLVGPESTKHYIKKATRTYDAESGERLSAVDQQAWITFSQADLRSPVKLAVSPDGRRIIESHHVGLPPAPPHFHRLVVKDAVRGRELAVLEKRNGYFSIGCFKAAFSSDGKRVALAGPGMAIRIWRRYRPEWWWGVFYMLEFWFSAGFATALVWSLLADRRAFARMDAEAARARENRSSAATHPGDAPRGE